MMSSSTGSTTWPPISLVTMSGRETCSSKPSRRIISIRIDSCSSPRPTIFICSGVSVGFLRRIDTFPEQAFAIEAILDLPRRDELAVATCHRRGVDAEDHRHGRFVNRRRRNRDPLLDVGDRLADGDVLDARQTNNVAGGRFLDLDPLQSVEGVQLARDVLVTWWTAD